MASEEQGTGLNPDLSKARAHTLSALPYSFPPATRGSKQTLPIWGITGANEGFTLVATGPHLPFTATHAFYNPMRRSVAFLEPSHRHSTNLV